MSQIIKYICDHCGRENDVGNSSREHTISVAGTDLNIFIEYKKPDGTPFDICLDDERKAIKKLANDIGA